MCDKKLCINFLYLYPTLYAEFHLFEGFIALITLHAENIKTPCSPLLRMQAAVAGGGREPTAVCQKKALRHARAGAGDGEGRPP